jgi:hypothetical protein
MLKEFRADLHIHTCLSPCGELSMSPGRIVNEAVRKRLDVIAICDHNSTENSAALMEAARGKALSVLPGLEITSREEVHICALFGGLEEALKMQALVYEHLEGENDEQAFGMQVVVDARGNVLGSNRRLLIGASGLSVEQVVGAIHARNGLAVASHIDRERFGIIGQLGFIPPQLALDALEISPHLTLRQAREKFREYERYPFLCSSDAHDLADIGAATTGLLLERASFEELKMALKGGQQRRVLN